MPAHITTIADAVVAALNAATFSEPHASVWAERRYRPVKKLEEMADKVFATVVPVGTAAEAITRGATKNRDVTIEIGVQRKISLASNDDADAMQFLVEEIENLFVGKELNSTTRCIASEIGPPYNLEHAEQMEVFTSVIRLTFRLVTA